MSNFSFEFDTAADEEFFGSLKSKSSKLQLLLDEDTLPEAEKQQSFKYQRPKASDFKSAQKNDLKSAESSKSSNAIRTLMAKVAMAYSQRQLQGKVGVALAEIAPDVLELVVYKSKENVFATLRLQSDRQSLFKQQNYWQFYDDSSKVDWSFCFEKVEDEREFQELLIAKGQKFQETKTNEKERNQTEINENKEKNFSKDLKFTQESSSDNGDLLKSPDSQDFSKTNLIKRMAKMGQPLPNLSNNCGMQTTTEFSDSSDTEVIKTPLTLAAQKPSIAPRRDKSVNLKNNQKQIIPSTAMALSSGTPIYTTISATNSNLESQYMQMLLTEQRTHGSELRMNVQKLDTKLEKVLDRLEDIERGNIRGDHKEHRHKDDEILELEEKILNLKKENRKLKQIIENSDHQRDTFEEKSKRILENFKNDLQSINIKGNGELETALKLCVEKIKENQKSLEDFQNKIKELELSNEEKENNLKSLKLSNENQELELKDIKAKNTQLNLTIQENLQTIQNLESKVKELQENLDKSANEKAQNSSLESATVVKGIMNNLFQNICSRITPSDCEDIDRVLQFVGMAIKQETLKALQK